MRTVFYLFVGFIFLRADSPAARARKEVYSWLSTEALPRDRTGKLTVKPNWSATTKMDLPYDTFVVSKTADSIRMIYSYKPAGDLFKKVNIHATRWKPKASYDNKFFFIGTYELDRLDGLYMSFYATKDWSSLLQIHYTNPGNMVNVLLFSKGPVNIFRQDGFVIDPNGETSEPERPVQAER